ncbi:MAG: RNA methyltransferase [Chlorobi bacterium]|nr:RNA methyltransferase [Chlorobiota bacterium]
MKRITSPKNEFIRKLKRLHSASQRRKQGMFPIVGKREVVRALEAKFPITHILSTNENPEISEHLRKNLANTELIWVSEHVMEELSYGETKPELLAIGKYVLPSPEDFDYSGRIVVLADIEKPGNIGAIMRVADATGSKVIIASEHIDPWNPNIIRASTGTIFSLPWVLLPPQEALRQLEKQGIPIVVATPEAEETYWDVDLKSPVAIVVGSEHLGVPQSWKDSADILVSIPMLGIADSLNTSASAALLLYESLRQERV